MAKPGLLFNQFLVSVLITIICIIHVSICHRQTVGVGDRYRQKEVAVPAHNAYRLVFVPRSV